MNDIMKPMKLTDQVVRSFHVAKNHCESNTDLRITAIDFSPNGENFVSCDSDDKIVVYECDSAKHKFTVNSRKYGVDLGHFTPDGKNVIHASTKVDDAIRFLSLDTMQYVRYFPGHTQKVSSLCVSPNGNSFLTGSKDRTLRFWDPNVSNSLAVMHTIGHPVPAYDPEGVLFAVGVDSESIKLYDIREFGKGPFKTLKLQCERDCEWTALKFSSDGKTIMVSTNGQVTRLIDAYEGKPLRTFTGPPNKNKIPIEASFSPDSQFIFTGSADGHVLAWNATGGYKICTLDGHPQPPVQCVKFNPRSMMLASASSNLAFWLPDPEKLQAL